MQANIRSASSDLRTNHFRTALRKVTKGIYTTHLNQPRDPRIDATHMDLDNSRKKYFGINLHYLVKLDGTIEIGRHPMTYCTFGPRRVASTHIIVGVVGGRKPDTGKREWGCTEAQREALEVLYQALSNALQIPLEIDEWIEKEDEELIAEEAAQEALDEELQAQEAMSI